MNDATYIQTIEDCNLVLKCKRDGCIGDIKIPILPIYRELKEMKDTNEHDIQFSCNKCDEKRIEKLELLKLYSELKISEIFREMNVKEYSKEIIKELV